MKLHNKFEIVQNGKVVACGFNKMFQSVLDALENYQGFATYVAVGGKLGQTESSLSGSTLCNALGIFRANEVEFQLNPLLGTMFAKRKITIGPNELVGAEISCVGFCSLPDGSTDDGESNMLQQTCSPSLFNYAEIKNDNNQNIVIAKNAGEVEIVSTIYLNWETTQGVLPIGGNNEFFKFLLGANSFGGNAPTFDFGVGCDHRPNSTQVEQDYIFTKKYVGQNVVPTVTKTSNSIEFLFSTTSNQNLLCCEIVLAANNHVVLRQNRDEFVTDEIGSETVQTSEYGVGTLQKFNAGNIVRVIDKSNNQVIMSTPEELAVLTTHQFPAVVSEPKANAFGAGHDYDSNWNVFESKCGNMLAFVSQSAVDIYSHKDGYIKKLDSSAIGNPQTITKIELFNEYVFVIRNVSPYIEMFEYRSETLVGMNLRLAEAVSSNMIGYSFNGTQQISIGKDGKGRITIAIKFDSNNMGIFVFECFGRIYSCTHFLKPALTSIGVFGALVAKGAEAGYVVVCGVDQTTYPNVYTYSADDGLVIVSSLLAANDFSTNVEEYSVGSNFIHIRRSGVSYNVIWFFDGNLRRIKPQDDQAARYKLCKNGSYAIECHTNSTDVSVLFIRENGAPVTFLTGLSQTEISSWQAIYPFGNSFVALLSTEPHCIYVYFPKYGYTTVKGLPESATLEIESKLSLPEFDKENNSNYLLSLIVEIGEE